MMTYSWEKFNLDQAMDLIQVIHKKGKISGIMPFHTKTGEKLQIPHTLQY